MLLTGDYYKKPNADSVSLGDVYRYFFGKKEVPVQETPLVLTVANVFQQAEEEARCAREVPTLLSVLGEDQQPEAPVQLGQNPSISHGEPVVLTVATEFREGENEAPFAREVPAPLSVLGKDLQPKALEKRSLFSLSKSVLHAATQLKNGLLQGGSSVKELVAQNKDILAFGGLEAMIAGVKIAAPFCKTIIPGYFYGYTVQNTPGLLYDIINTADICLNPGAIIAATSTLGILLLLSKNKE